MVWTMNNGVAISYSNFVTKDLLNESITLFSIAEDVNYLSKTQSNATS
jgi:hypothetical protein